MYGIIYVAIKDYAEATFSAAVWSNILADSNTGISFNSTEQPYDENIIFRFAEAVHRVTGTDLNKALYGMGKQVVRTTAEKYPHVLLSRGDSLQEYLLNLPAYHNRVSLIYPELTPPEFRVAGQEHDSLTLQYLYKRKDIAPYVEGYLCGIAHYFEENARVAEVAHKGSSRYKAFNISW